MTYNCQPFRSTWVHTIPEHLSSHPIFSSVRVRVARSGFFPFYVVFRRSLSVPLLFLFWILCCVVPSSLCRFWFPLGIFQLCLFLHGAKIIRWRTDIINVIKWNLKEECQTQKYLQLCKILNINHRGVGNHRKNIDAMNTRKNPILHKEQTKTKRNHGFIVILELVSLSEHMRFPYVLMGLYCSLFQLVWPCVCHCLLYFLVHRSVCSSKTYGLWLPLWYLLTRLRTTVSD
jgi:hypothetical protein